MVTGFPFGRPFGRVSDAAPLTTLTVPTWPPLTKNFTFPPGVVVSVPVPIVAVKVTDSPTLKAVPLAGDVRARLKVEDCRLAPVPIRAMDGVPLPAPPE